MRGEMLDEEAVRIAPVVEQLAALDVAADTPGAEIPAVFEVFAARGERVQVAHLVCRVHVSIAGPQRQGDGVVVGETRAAVAADETHHRPAGALAGIEEEVTDDHSEGVEVEVKRLTIFGGLQDDVAQPLDACGYARRALGGVGAISWWPTLKTRGCCGVSSVNSCVPATARTGRPPGSIRLTEMPPSDSGSGVASRSSGFRQSKDVDLVDRLERGPDEARPGAPSQQYAGRAASVPRNWSSSACVARG